ncbi:Type I restriction enzyme EcoKI specificity protein [Paraburkholderia caribensis]|uniref:restriction endonuclease subunit S n=1 Tax=Paraburkholderia caribensis TaxID=75105 RepID=UPI001CABFC11|nr:restriction endonuclease subunit S [Paraburkholderia caribensis]CAG9229812.1 Type I restriction enzyme EcoKI specificity protein [Paraburkholderia caribensis]
MSLPSYPQYKASGVAWLHDVPAHWRISPLKYLVSLKSGGTPSKDNLDYWDGEVPWASAKDLKTETLADTIDHISSLAVESGNADLVPEGTILVVVRGMILARTFPVAETLVPMAINQDLKGLIPRTVLTGRFLAWLLRGTASESLLRLDEAGHGTKALRMDAWTSMQLPIPPVDEQSTIAAFLDRETGKIDALIAEQEKLLTLLAEKRLATISHAVTRGLHSDVSMKDSGVAWLGKVPEHWGVGALTRISERVVVGIAEAATHAYQETGVPILRSMNIRAGRIEGDILHIDPAFAAERGSKLIGAGDLVTVRTGNAGVTAVVPMDLDQCQCFTMLITTLEKGHSAAFYCYWMNSEAAKCYFQLEGWGTAQVNISVPILKALPVPIPPAIEQDDIVAFIEKEVGKLDELTVEARHAIDLLKERRGALISAAVTGKIDVRDAAPQELAA